MLLSLEIRHQPVAELMAGGETEIKTIQQGLNFFMQLEEREFC